MKELKHKAEKQMYLNAIPGFGCLGLVLQLLLVLLAMFAATIGMIPGGAVIAIGIACIAVDFVVILLWWTY